MNKRSSIIFFSLISFSASPALSGEFITLVAESTSNEGFSNSINLSAGDTAEVKYQHTIGDGGVIFATIAGTIFTLSASTVGGANPLIIAGPASIKVGSGGPGITTAAKSFATVEVNRAGTASNATAIPLETGTTWQVILEASTDLVNWTAVSPGDYPSASPQRFFRTRLVKRS